MIQIVTMNVKGLQNDQKRQEIFQYCKKLNYDIIMMQETHSTVKDEFKFRTEWKGEIIFAHGSSQARGSAILFSNKIDAKITKSTTCLDGRYVIADIKIDEKELMLVNVYAPNEDSPDFFLEIFSKMAEHTAADRIIAGDFNLVLNPNKDSLNRKKNNKKALSVINSYISESQMVDVWRERNPDCFQFTWYTKKPKEIFARLDYMLINYGLSSDIVNIKNSPAFRTDHNAVVMECEFKKDDSRGPGFWKLNTSLLESLENLKIIKQRITESLVKAKQEKYDDCLTWESTKAAIVKECQKISKAKAEKFRNEIKSLQELREFLMVKRSNEKLNSIEKEAIDAENNVIEKQLSKHIEYKTQGAKIRSRSNWYKQGEKMTKYFFGLEKVKYKNKTIRQLLCEDGEVTRDERKILQEQTKFYKGLYSKDSKINFLYENNSGCALNEEDKQKLDEPFSFEEFGKALKGMAKGKAPGNDGLPPLLYIYFWKDIGEILWKAVQLSHKRGEMYLSARRGVVSLIPKKHKNSQKIADYRPITLLNTDQKIVTKMLTNRLKPYLDVLIGKQQSGYVPGRFIGINLRKLIDLIQFIEEKELDCVLISVDFKKCFDSINHEALTKSLMYFNIGKHFISWVLMIYKNFELCTINNGRWSNYFPQERGVHQGSALSGPLFLFVGEILAHKIKENKSIKGIEVGNEEEKLGQYADDTNIWSLAEEKSVNEIIKELETFHLNTGLEVNYDKTMVYKIGKKENKRRLYFNKKFKWAKGNIDMLGLIINSENVNYMEAQNYDEVFDKILSVANSWQNRSLSLIGKIEVVNALMNSKLVYKMQVLPEMSEERVKRLSKIISDFIWNGRRPKIKSRFLHLDKKQGGRRLANIARRDKALKIEWIRRIHDGDKTLEYLAYYHLKTEIKDELFWQCNLNKGDINVFNIKSKFWKSVLEAWCEINFKIPKSESEKANQILWYNSLFKIAGSVFVIKEMFQKGIYTVKDLVIENRIMTCNEVNEIFDLNIRQMQYNSLISSIPQSYKIAACRAEVQEVQETNLYTELTAFTKWSKIVYDKMNVSEEALGKVKQIWERKLKIKIEMDEIKEAFTCINKSIEISKYRAFQYRFLHNAIFLNDRLVHLAISESNVCTMCGNEKETTCHFFVRCRIVRKIWKDVAKYFKQQYEMDTTWIENEKSLLLSTAQYPPCINLIIIVVKQKVFAAKCSDTKPNAQACITEIEFIHELERNNVKTIKQAKRYNEKWPDSIVIENDDNFLDLEE